MQKIVARLVCREMVTLLGEKGYDAHYAEDLEEAKAMILAMIPPGSSIALGGSETIAAMGLLAPLNAKRIRHETPCTETGRCLDCQVQKRLCNYVGLIYHGRKFPGRISVVMVAEEVGF